MPIDQKASLQKLPHLSKFGLFASISFILLSFLTRYFYPFGDEPDFSVRATSLILGEPPIWTPYYYISPILEKLQYISSCQIISSPFSLLAKIDSYTCKQSIEQIFLRLFILIIIVFPILYAITFRRSFVLLARILACKSTTTEWTERLNTLSVAILFPGTIYYLGVLSVEQFTLLLSLLIFLFWRSLWMIIILCALLFSLDKGNAFIVISFIILHKFSLQLTHKFSLKKYAFIIAFLGILLFSANFLIIEYLSYLSFLQNKIAALMNKYSTGITKKYPLIVRPIITYMTFISLTPTYIKTIGAYIVTSVAILISILKITYRIKKKKNHHDITNIKINILSFINPIFIILIYTFILPDYANGKYYIFMLPFMLQMFLSIYNKKHLYVFMLTLNTIIFFHLHSYTIF